MKCLINADSNNWLNWSIYVSNSFIAIDNFAVVQKEANVVKKPADDIGKFWEQIFFRPSII